MSYRSAGMTETSTGFREIGPVPRTRLALLSAATSVWARDPGASLGAIAAAAGTSRSTLNRYFPDRDTLVAALRAHVSTELTAATERGHPSHGTGIAALLRVCAEYGRLRELLTVAYGDLSGRDDHQAATTPDPALVAIVERGQTDGSIDPTLPATWIVQVMWCLLDASWATGEPIDPTGSPLHITALERMLAPAVPHSPRSPAPHGRRSERRSNRS